ncbi:MAG: hypothetical protein H0U18_10815 [Pyrinomonadaceae bacterium]|nr:hypothetical protein [Pyrinomonadaceae bacterium]
MATKKSSKKASSSAERSASISSTIIFTGLSDKQITSLRAAKQAAAEQLLQPVQTMAFSALAASTSPEPSTNLVGVGIGEQISGGKHTGVMAVKFLVRIKYPDNQISDSDRLPREVNGYPVDVEQVGTFRRFMPPSSGAAPAMTMPDPRKKIRPAQPGCSIGFKDPNNQFIMAGTFGALVSKGTKRFILSNNHVIADENNLPLGSSIFQPGFLDAGNPPNNGPIAKLTKFIPLVPGTVTNKVDGAIAELNNKNLATNSVLFIGPPKGKTAGEIDMVVHKFGRTTGFTVGRITSVETDVSVQYDAGIVNFQDQIIIVGLGAQPFSASGDSGSLILERSTNKAVALLFAGSSTHTIANHIKDVLSALSVTLTL